ncbi:hypothetical protein HSACCH_01295 [Halanaerobium saccharolyticum subsp. saccharolyticum DSM 6643]|uniref:Prepilin-type N-terminal cleavage/methylation domain-containing protein n=1 Tax=Halanaerobium saccharolyticum subsp. saccharolyticum DSM 6643 TaxID=1293054 RepID=M5EE95_9FIRM|nr:prepilin-type N-terminal cleavage/methylation domain-containing protein [Halanaerobium saccharolyticum]CCU79388.1 hypothetical protein HSACCH_01295 [Halanaerobium saccharolyticum subsp. saccharolyticum DSM 6643]
MKTEKGFTLIEVMITVAIVAVIAAAVYNAYFSSLQAWNYNKSRMEVQRVQDLTHRWISQYARKATAVNPNYNNSSLTSDQDILYLEYNDAGTTKAVAFGRGSNTDDYLYFYDLTNSKQRKITDLKFTDPNFSFSNGLIQITANIINQETTNNYQFNSYFNTRLLK